MRPPKYKFIVSYIAECNRFISIEEIINNQVEKEQKSRGELKLYIYTTLNRLKLRGQIISIEEKANNRVLWGLPGWIDIKGNPLNNHKPKHV